MPIFRFHRGSLKDSMKTCFHVKTKEELFNKLWDLNILTNKPISSDDMASICLRVNNIDQLIIRDYMFDKRIGWDTKLVLIGNTCVTRDPYIIGFLSEDFQK